jgi:glycosyltransferase involved in cell wall biosynthesis
MKSPPRKQISVIIPARNEAACIERTLIAVLKSAASLRAPERGNCRPEHLAASAVEVLVIDNQSTDATGSILREFSRSYGVQWIQCERLGAPCARNCGTQHAASDLYVFLDADTCIPLEGLRRVSDLVTCRGYEAGIFALQGDQDTWSSRCWWTFWNAVRRLPLARAKALPAFMFCTRAIFDRFGPFDETVQIGEEWPILAELYRRQPERLVYDRSIRAITSNRRMTRQRYGYAKLFFKYIWAVLHRSGRNGYPDTIRE